MGAVDLERVWFLRWSARLPGPSFVWLIGVCGAAAGITALSQRTATSQAHQPGRLELWAPYLAYYAVALYGSALPLFLRAARQVFDRLRAHMSGSPEDLDAWRWRLSHYQGAGYRVFTGLTIVSTFGIQELNSHRWSRIADGDWRAFDIVAALAAFAGLAVLLQATFLLVYIARTLRQVTVSAWHPPLFDQRCGLPLVLFGLQVVLLLTVANVGSAMLLVQSASDTTISLWTGALFVFGVNAVMAVAVILLPVLVWRTKIRQQKADELDRVGRAIAGDSRVPRGQLPAATSSASNLIATLRTVLEPFPPVATFLSDARLPPGVTPRGTHRQPAGT